MLSSTAPLQRISDSCLSQIAASATTTVSKQDIRIYHGRNTSDRFRSLRSTQTRYRKSDRDCFPIGNHRCIVEAIQMSSLLDRESIRERLARLALLYNWQAQEQILLGVIAPSGKRGTMLSASDASCISASSQIMYWRPEEAARSSVISGSRNGMTTHMVIWYISKYASPVKYFFGTRHFYLAEEWVRLGTRSTSIPRILLISRRVFSLSGKGSRKNQRCQGNLAQYLQE